MKWLIFLLLVSCGKHEQPKALDLNDNDGDLIVNQEDQDKDIANYRSLSMVSGKMNFIGNEKYEFSFSNGRNLKEDSLDLIVGDHDYNHRDHFFSEWAELKLYGDKKSITIKDEITTLNFIFDEQDDNPDEVILVNGKEKKKVADWKPFTKISILRHDLDDVLNGRASFHVRKKDIKSKFSDQSADKTIEDKTNKIYKYDGTKASVYYVAKTLNDAELLKIMNVTSLKNLNDEKLFFNSHEQGSNEWFQRIYENGDRVLYYGKIQDIKISFLEKFSYKKTLLRRENGRAVTALTVTNNKDEPVYLKIRPGKIVRTFKDEQRIKNFSKKAHDDEIIYTCFYNFRDVASEKYLVPTISEFLQTLKQPLKQDEDFKIKENQDEKGIFWEMIIYPKINNMRLDLFEQSSETYTTTGYTFKTCESGQKPKESMPQYQTNVEASLNFEIESYSLRQ